MRQFFYICILAANCVALAAVAAEQRPRTLSCSQSADKTYCEKKKSDFLANWQLANSGDYIAQREVAFCLSSGCSGAVPIDNPAACKWQTVIVSGSKSDASDSYNYRTACGLLSAAERDSAINDARILYGTIYKKVMVKPLPYLKAN